MSITTTINKDAAIVSFPGKIEYILADAAEPRIDPIPRDKKTLPNFKKVVLQRSANKLRLEEMATKTKPQTPIADKYATPSLRLSLELGSMSCSVPTGTWLLVLFTNGV